MTHTSTEQQPEALRLARWLEHRSMSGVQPNDLAASTELRRLYARVQELEASKEQREPLDEEAIERVTGVKQGTPMFLAATGFVRATEQAHGI